jgi:signal transduction histidine kinase
MMQPTDKGNDPVSLKQRAADDLTVMFAYWDQDLVCRFANSAYQNCFGGSKDLAGKVTFPELFGVVYEEHKSFVEGALAGGVQHFSWTMPSPGEGVREMLVSFFPDIDKGSVQGFLMYSTNGAHPEEQKKHEIQSDGIINAQNKSLLNFANMVSHNLRSYAGNLEVMLAMYESEGDTAERAKIFGFLKEISAGFKSSIENLSELVKVQNLSEIPMQQVNLHTYTMKAASVLHTQVEATRATIFNYVSPEISIEANPAYVESIILNFMDNALKYRHPDRKPVIELSAMQVNNETVLSIKDNGIGMDLERNRQRLYGMYNTFHGNQDATGIGLFITKYQVDSMGGHIGVESGVGKGTWFRVYFKTRT